MRKSGRILFVALVFFFFISGVANAGTWMRSVTVEKIKQTGLVPGIVVKDSNDSISAHTIYGNGSLESKKMILAVAMLAFSTQDEIDFYYTANGVVLIMVHK